MASFRKDKTTSANTAIMTAGGVVEALVGQGIVTADILVEVFERFVDSALAKASPVVDADNALFAAVEAAEGGAPRQRSSAAKAETPTASNPADQVFPGGKFKGCTISEVYALTEAEAKAKGHTYGPGATYIDNYAATDKNTNEQTREAAKRFLAALKEG